MLLFNRKRKREAKEAYDTEYIKQTDPYRYYLTSDELRQIVNENERVNKGEHENVPFICMKEDIKFLSEDDRYRLYETDDYFIYESINGESSPEERAKLITFARKYNSDLTYSDVDYIDCDEKRSLPFYKPGFGTDTNRCFNYYTDFYAVKKEKSKMDLSLLENISHVTEVLFHYKYRNNIDYLKDIYKINNNSYLTDGFYADNQELLSCKDLISIIIPSKDNPKLISACLDGITRAKVKSGINTIEIIIVDNGSTDIHKEEITGVIEKTKSLDLDISIIYIYEAEEFNFSNMCNKGAARAKGEYLLFMNDDIEVLDEYFLLKLLYFAKMDHIGAVGCKLLYPGPEKRIQHIGITNLKLPGPTHKLSTFPDEEILYFGRNRGVHNCLAVTGACLMVSKEKFFKTGGFYDKMKVGYNDVDLCLSLYESGYLNLVDNECILIHHESISRGLDLVSEEKMNRLDKERNLLYERHPWVIEKGDPYYNPNLAEDFLDYRVNVIPEFERRDYVSRAKESLNADVRLLDDRYKDLPKNMFFSIDSTIKNRRFIEVIGWALINKKDNYIYDKYLVVRSKTSGVKTYTTAPVYRRDLKEAFMDARYVDLSGFFARIPATEFTTDDEIGVLLINKQTGKKYYARK